MPDADAVSIGTFARATRLTVKALRHYHDIGVLVPATVDPATNYRYYRWEQLPDAICISTLRDLGVPLDRVRQHLSGGMSLLEVLSGERERLERQVAAAQVALSVIDSLRTDQHADAHEPEIVTWHERPTVNVSVVVRGDELETEVPRLIPDLLDAAERSGADPTTPIVGEYPLVLETTTTITLHLPILDTSAKGFAGAGRLPGGTMVRTVHVGPHAALPLSYAHLLRWAASAGHTVSGPVFETYLDDPAYGSDPLRIRTELAVPLGG